MQKLNAIGFALLGCLSFNFAVAGLDEAYQQQVAQEKLVTQKVATKKPAERKRNDGESAHIARKSSKTKQQQTARQMPDTQVRMDKKAKNDVLEKEEKREAERAKLADEKTKEAERKAAETQPIVTANFKYYFVQRGDTVYSIARANNVLTDEIVKLNYLEIDKSLEVGQRLLIPIKVTQQRVPVIHASKLPLSASLPSSEHDDEIIENNFVALINRRFSSASSTHINVTSFNRIVLISGEVKDDADRQNIFQLVANVSNVRLIHNRLVVSPTTSLSSHANDTVITSNVKLLAAKAGDVRPESIKIVTENNTVFLMGLVSHREAAKVIEIASTTSGVVSVEVLFEYID